MFYLGYRRKIAVLLIFTGAFLLVTARMWVLQVRESWKYTALALEQESQFVSAEEVWRGRILDRNLVPLNGQREEKRLVIFPALIEKSAAEGIAKGLAPILGVDPFELKERLLGAKSPFCLPHPLTEEQEKAVLERGWRGVMVLPFVYYYGERPLAVNVAGHLGKIASPEELHRLSQKGDKFYRLGDLVGKAGLEAIYEYELKGVKPEYAARIFYDAAGRILPGSARVEEKITDTSRCDVVLTLDGRIQAAVEDVMDKRGVRGAVVVLEAGSGDILAMASRPTYRPDRLTEVLRQGEDGAFIDRCTALYQPGSVFKIIVAAAAIEEGTASEERTFFCRGKDDWPVGCHEEHGHGELDLKSAFALSCNPVFARLGNELGAEKLATYAVRFGLENQGAKGYPLDLDKRQDLTVMSKPYNLANVSIGQGPVLVSPLQVAAVVNAIVSGGVYTEPRLVQEVRSRSGRKVREVAADPGVPVISPRTAGALRGMMELAVESGTGKKAHLEYYGSAGKTGSAESGSRTDAWFAGYAPRDNPRYVAVVLVENGQSGGESAAPLFKEIMERILEDDRP